MSFTNALKGLSSNAWDTPTQAAPAGTGEQQLDIASIDPDPNQPRKQFDEDKIKELADSIQEHGLQQPVGVRPNPDQAGRYLLSFGERRLRACSLLGWSKIPAVIREGGNSTAIALIENLQREDLSAWEVSIALAAYAEAHNKKPTQVAADIGKSNSYVSEHLAIKKMPDDFQKALQAGTVNDVRTLNDAFALYKQYPAEATKLVVGASTDAPLTRDKVRQVTKGLKGEDARPKGGKAQAIAPDPDGAGGEGQAGQNRKAPTAAATLPRIVIADSEGSEIGYLDLTRSSGDGLVYVFREEGEASSAEDAGKLRLVRVELATS